MDIHKLLKRQLERSSLNIESRPQTNELWQKFIARVSQTYHDADQERYMHERSMNISSKEMMDLNEKLEHAQHIARLGYWTYDGLSDRSIWSKESFALLNLNPADKPPGHKQLSALVHEIDYYEIKQKIISALKDKKDFECEARLINAEGIFQWYRIIGQCLSGEQQIAGVIFDIHKNKLAEEKIIELNQQIASTARRAGMAEVATTILHNIGNILNSSNVSINLLKTNLSQDYIKKLFKVFEMLEQHQGNVLEFLNNDEKGHIIPDYLVAVSKILREDHQKNNQEIDSLIDDLNHINKIVAMQKTISGLSSMNEKLYLPDIVDTAIKMSISTTYNNSILITKDYRSCPLINTDKSKLLQILVNLIHNAKDAVILNLDNPIKEINFLIKKLNHNAVQVIVSDNGIGIDPLNLSEIFSFGFTTKKNGHGFGLHSSALSAESMGGSLFAESSGLGFGAQFILTLPISKGVANE